MQEELKYPIKYAIMPIYEQVGFTHGLNELEKDYDVVCNIVMKCYVISEKKRYYSDGHNEVKYEVVFLYNHSYDNYLLFNSVVPEYNFYSNECYNSLVVDKLFDDYNLALEECQKSNDVILTNKLLKVYFKGNYKEEIAKVEKEHNETLDKYKKIANDIEQQTANIKVSSLADDSLNESDTEPSKERNRALKLS